MTMEPDDPGDLIHMKWLLDGVATLSEAANRLRDEADRIEGLERDGYQLGDVVQDGYLWLEREVHPSVHPSEVGIAD